MTIYQVRRDAEDVVVEANELPPGDRQVNFAGLSVPIVVYQDESVLVRVAEAGGHLSDLSVYGFGEDQYWSAEQARRVGSALVHPKFGETVVNLFGVEEGTDDFISVVRASENPLGKRGAEIG